MKKNNNSDKLKNFFTKNRLMSILAFLIVLTFLLKDNPLLGAKEDADTHYIPYAEFSKMVEKNEVEYVFFNPSNQPSTIQFLPTVKYLRDNNINITNSYLNLTETLSKSKDTTVSEKTLPKEGNLKFVTENPSSQDLKTNMLMKGIRVFYVKTSTPASMILLYALYNFLPMILIIGLLVYYQRRMEPSEAELLTEVPDTKFESIAGYDGLKSDSKFILDFLKNPKSYEEMGARLPNGVLFYGPPGTGKTLMAKAIAGEANVPFYKVNGSDFVELYVGLGARRVRKLYKTARENAPCIVFIDEIDSIGGARGNHRGSSEDDKTLTALLNELDGFAAKKGVITIAATNRLQDLDPALVRPGRFDRQVAVPLPNKEERKEILNLYTKGKKISDEIDTEVLAAKTIDFSPSELENLLNEAAINAVTRGADDIRQEDIDDSYLKIIIKGDKKEDKSQSEEEKRVIAYHESGHAIIAHVLGKPVLEVSIIGTTSGAGGYTLSQPKEGLRTKLDMQNEIKELYGGRAGEVMIAKSEDEITIGAVSDIQRATQIINSYIKILGLNGSLINLEELGMTRPSEDIIKQAQEISKQMFEEDLEILRANRDKLDKLAKRLIEKSLIDGKEFLEIMHPEEETLKEKSEDKKENDDKEEIKVEEKEETNLQEEDKEDKIENNDEKEITDEDKEDITEKDKDEKDI